MSEFKALRVTSHDGSVSCRFSNLSLDQLPNSEVLIKIHFSALNYKDALSASGHKGVTRELPHTPGIDAAGVVVRDSSGQFRAGERVIVSGYDFGMNHDGGLAQYCCVPATWVCRCPQKLSFRSAMVLGTAGITAALALDKLSRMVALQNGGDFVVTGASGGVGALAIALAHLRGLRVTAISAKAEEFERLKSLGAYACIELDQWLDITNKPLLKPQFNLGLDTLGGEALEQLLKVMRPEGALAMCGMASSAELHSTVYPFILRGVSLLGIDSAELSLQKREQLWSQLAEENLPFATLADETDLSEVPQRLTHMLNGQARGRCVVKIATELD